MSILIKGMEMPTTCCNCDFMAFNPEILWEDAMGKQRGAYVCKRTGELIDNTKREDHCPLIEIPTHGDLIDRDELLSQYGGPIWTAKTDYAEGLRDVVADIKCAAAIIGAEPCNDLAKPNIDADYPPSTPLEQVWTEVFGEEGE